MKAWVRRHPWITGTLGTLAAAGATYYGGPVAGKAATTYLPQICAALGWCA